jgi:hypothetical protein
MLFDFDGHLVDIIREEPYSEVLTVRASSGRHLRPFRRGSVADMVKVPHHLYPFVIHIGEYSLPFRISIKDQMSVENLPRITPEPACFVYDYAYEDEGKVTGDYGYCWPSEVEKTRESLMCSEKELLGEPVFLPLFRIPGELINAPIKFPEGEIEFKSWDDIDEDKPDNEK